MKKIRKQFITTTLILISALLLCGAATAATYDVNPGDNIQNTINSAADGDLIRVNDGGTPYTYNEGLTISKMINLTANGNVTLNRPLTAGNGNVITVTANYVNITGFKLTSSVNGSGIQVIGSDDCIISNNQVTYMTNVGIYVNGEPSTPCLNNQLINNTLNYNAYGIYMRISRNSLIQGNSMYGNILDGLTLEGESNDGNNVIMNTITGNKRYGIISNSGGNLIHYNRVCGNTLYQMFNRRYIEDAQYNWWGSNDNPYLSNKFGGERPDLISFDPWIIMNLEANPNTVTEGDVSTITASFNQLSDGNSINPSMFHIPDGTPVLFNTNMGTIGSLQIIKYTINGVATASLTTSAGPGTYVVDANTDGQTKYVHVIAQNKPAPPVPNNSAKLQLKNWGRGLIYYVYLVVITAPNGVKSSMRLAGYIFPGKITNLNLGEYQVGTKFKITSYLYNKNRYRQTISLTSHLITNTWKWNYQWLRKFYTPASPLNIWRTNTMGLANIGL